MSLCKTCAHCSRAESTDAPLSMSKRIGGRLFCDVACRDAYERPRGKPKPRFVMSELARIGPELTTKDGTPATFAYYAALSETDRRAQFDDAQRAKGDRMLAEFRKKQTAMVIDAPPALPEVPTSLLATARAPVDGNTLLFILSNVEHVVYVEPEQDTAWYWQTQFTEFPDLRAIVADPERVRALLAQVPIKQVHDAASSFVKNAFTEVEEDTPLHSALLNVVEGIARRYSTVAAAHSSLWNLCRKAMRGDQPFVLAQLLQRNSARGRAVVDLARVRIPQLEVVFSEDRDSNYELLRILLDWRGPAGEYALLSNNFQNLTMGTMTRLFNEYPLVATFAVRRGLLENWFRKTLSGVEDDSNAMRVALLNVPVREGLGADKLDLSRLMPLVAESEIYTRYMDASLLDTLRQWRGSHGEYIDFAQIFYDQIKRYRQRQESDVNYLGSERIPFYLAWRSPDGTRFVDLSDEQTLLTVCYIRPTRLISDQIMQWVGPAGQRVASAKFFYAVLRSEGPYPASLFADLHRYNDPPNPSPVSTHNETEARIIFKRLSGNTTIVDQLSNIASIITHMRISVPSAGSSNAVPFADWLLQNGGQRLFELMTAGLGAWGLSEMSTLAFAFRHLPRRSIADSMVLYARVLFGYRRDPRRNKTGGMIQLELSAIGADWPQLAQSTTDDIVQLHLIADDSTRVAIVDRAARELIAMAQTIRLPGDPPFSVGEIFEDDATLDWRDDPAQRNPR